jgi:hypothetical protein
MVFGVEAMKSSHDTRYRKSYLISFFQSPVLRNKTLRLYTRFLIRFSQSDTAQQQQSPLSIIVPLVQTSTEYRLAYFMVVLVLWE